MSLTRNLSFTLSHCTAQTYTLTTVTPICESQASESSHKENSVTEHNSQGVSLAKGLSDYHVLLNVIFFLTIAHSNG